MFAIVRKTLFEKRFAILGWSIGAAFMVWLTMIFYPSFSQGNQLSDLIQSLPPQLQGLVGKAADYKTIGGYVDTVVFNLRVPLVTIIMAITFGISISAGDEEQGVLSTLLAQPVSRTRVLAEKLAALVTSIFVVHAAVLTGLLLSLVGIGESYSFDKLLSVTFGCFVLSLLFGVLAFGLGCLTGRRNLSMGIVSIVAFGSFLIDSMASSVAGLSTVQKFLPFYYYTTPSLAVNGVDWSYIFIQAVAIAAIIGVAWAWFRHRDIAV
ncbi:MAG: ABC transporter permease subunit [Candidatus Saccharibacteria bacterium]